MSEPEKKPKETAVRKLRTDGEEEQHLCVEPDKDGDLTVWIERDVAAENEFNELASSSVEADDGIGRAVVGALRALVKPGEGTDDFALLVEPKEHGGYWLTALPKNFREPAKVLVSSDGPEHAALSRLYAAMDGVEEKDPIDETRLDLVTLVLPPGRRTFPPGHALAGRSVAILVEDVLDMVDQIVMEIDGAPGDPGRALSLVERVRGVAEQARRVRAAG